MFTTSGTEFVSVFRHLRSTVELSPPTMKMAMLVSPRGFCLSDQSADDNRYMLMDRSLDIELCHRQHQGVARTITELGVPVVTFAGREGMDDGIFPNNVFASTPDVSVIGRMFHPVRHKEAGREDIRRFLSEGLGRPLIDLSADRQAVCELTGSCAIDRALAVNLCGLSRRSTLEGAQKVHKALGQALSFAFELDESEYHTNIMLAILAGKVVLAYPGSFKHPQDCAAIAQAYGSDFIEISEREKNHFVANSIAITPGDILFSATALDSMESKTRAALENRGLSLHAVNVDELEKAGGSLRCLIAEIF